MWGWRVLVGVAVAGLWRAGEAERARAADRFAREVDLALPPELLPILAEHRAARTHYRRRLWPATGA